VRVDDDGDDDKNKKNQGVMFGCVSIHREINIYM